MWITPQEAGEKFGVSRSTLYRWMREGKISSRKSPTGRRLFNEEELRHLLDVPKEGEGDEDLIASLREFGVAGIQQGVWPIRERLTELTGVRGILLLREMRWNDPVIAPVFLILENFIRRATFTVRPASERPADIEAAEFVEGCLHDMSYSWRETLGFILDMFEVGTSVLEIVYKRRLGPDADPPSRFDDGRIGWRKWAFRPLETLDENQPFLVDAQGGIKGIRQVNPETGEIIKIPIHKLLIFRTTTKTGPQGIPLHRAAYLPWWYSVQLTEMEAIAIERDASGIPVMYLGDDATLSGPQSDFERAKRIVTGLRMNELAGVVLPKPKLGTAGEGRGMLLELLSSPGRSSRDTNAIINRHDQRKALALLASFILLGNAQTGSYATARVLSDLLEVAIASWLDVICDVINAHAIPRLMRLNAFPGITGYPRLVAQPTPIPDLRALETFISGLATIGALTPDDELERHLRQVANLPPPVKGERRRRPGRPLEQTALILRRLILAMEPLRDLGFQLDPEEQRLLIEPLLEELKEALSLEAEQIAEDSGRSGAVEPDAG